MRTSSTSRNGKIVLMSQAYYEYSAKSHGSLMILLVVGIMGCFTKASALAAEGPIELQLDQGQTVVVVGNTFAERMQLFGYFECLLHSSFPDHQLTVRNLGWPADEVGKMIRPAGFPALLDQLEKLQPNLILLCFGMNESFSGAAFVDAYQRALEGFVGDLCRHNFDGQSPPEIVLVSPIAHEYVNQELPDGVAHNQHLRLYSEAMQRLAAGSSQVHYVDLFSSTSLWKAAHPERQLTINGIHLSEYGDWIVSQMLARSLGLLHEENMSSGMDKKAIGRYRRLIYEKNYQFSQWWHPLNASYIHGRRKDTPGAKHLASEREQLLLLIGDYEKQIWEMAKPTPAEICLDEPIEGQPIWYPTPSDREIAGIDQPSRWSYEGDGQGQSPILTPAEQLELFDVPDGYAVNLFASEVRFPIANPMAIHFDTLGQMWVANTPTWPHPLPGKQPDDSLVVLRDSDGDGLADQHAARLSCLRFGGIGEAPAGSYSRTSGRS